MMPPDDHLNPGQALDVLIHEQVMGLCVHVLLADWPPNIEVWIIGTMLYKCAKCHRRFDAVIDDQGQVDRAPAYSTDMNAALLVIEHLMARGYRYVIRGNWKGNGQHVAGFDAQEWADLNPLYQPEPCASIPLAICRAALEVMQRGNRLDEHA